MQYNHTRNSGRIQYSREQIDDQNLRRYADNSTLLVQFLPRHHIRHLCIHQAQAARLGRVTDDGVLGQKLADPAIFEVVSAHDDDEIVAGDIVCMEQVAHYLEEAEAAGDYEERVFFAQLMEYVLLEFLREWSMRA